MPSVIVHEEGKVIMCMTKDVNTNSNNLVYCKTIIISYLKLIFQLTEFPFKLHTLVDLFIQ